MRIVKCMHRGTQVGCRNQVHSMRCPSKHRRYAVEATGPERPQATNASIRIQFKVRLHGGIRYVEHSEEPIRGSTENITLWQETYTGVWVIFVRKRQHTTETTVHKSTIPAKRTKRAPSANGAHVDHSIHDVVVRKYSWEPRTLVWAVQRQWWQYTDRITAVAMLLTGDKNDEQLSDTNKINIHD